MGHSLPGGFKPWYGELGTMGKQERMEQLARLFEEGRIVIPSRMPVKPSWKPESDASLALRFALSGSGTRSFPTRISLSSTQG